VPGGTEGPQPVPEASAAAEIKPCAVTTALAPAAMSSTCGGGNRCWINHAPSIAAACSTL